MWDRIFCNGESIFVRCIDVLRLNSMICIGFSLKTNESPWFSLIFMQKKTWTRCGSHETLRIEAFLYDAMFNENPLFSLKTMDFLWFALIFHWKSIKIHDFHWIFIENQRKSIIFMELSLKIKENPWFSLNFHWKSMKIHDFHWFSCRKRRGHAADHTKRYV